MFSLLKKPEPRLYYKPHYSHWAYYVEEFLFHVVNSRNGRVNIGNIFLVKRWCLHQAYILGNNTYTLSLYKYSPQPEQAETLIHKRPESIDRNETDMRQKSKKITSGYDVYQTNKPQTWVVHFKLTVKWALLVLQLWCGLSLYYTFF